MGGPIRHYSKVIRTNIGFRQVAQHMKDTTHYGFLSFDAKTVFIQLNSLDAQWQSPQSTPGN